MARLAFSLIAAALLAAPLAAQQNAGAPTAEESRQLAAIGARGKLLFDLDRAAWIASDDLLARLRDPAASGLKGYVVEPEAGGFVVTFFGGEPGKLLAMYVARVAGGRVTSGRLLPAAERVPLTPMQARLAQLRSVAAGFGERPCTSKGFNVAIIPPASPDEPADMYLTTPQTETGVYPFGGHYLLRVDKDGRLLSTRKFTNSCLNMEVPGRGRRVKQPTALFVTHVLDPVPTEIHAFISLGLPVPVVVMTIDPKRIWVVHKGLIGLGATAAEMDRPGRRRR